MLTTANLGLNLYIGNNPEATGSYVPLREGREDPRYERPDAVDIAEAATGRALSPTEVSNYWVGRAWAFARAEPDAWAKLQLKKWLLVWNDLELADSEDYYIYRERSLVLRLIGWCSGFGIVFPLAVMGVWLTWGDRRQIWILYAMILTLALSIAAFFVFARYRFSLVPILLILAGGGLTRAYALVARQRFGELAKPAALAVAAAALSHAPVMRTDSQTVSALVNLAIASTQLEKFDEALDYADRALEIAPDCLPAQYSRAKALRRMGHVQQAVGVYQEILSRDATHESTMVDMGLLAMEGGDFGRASDLFSRVIDQNLDHAVAHSNYAIVLSRMGREEEAQRHCLRAIELRPRDASAYVNMGGSLLRTGDAATAVQYLSEAVDLDPTNHAARFNLGYAYERVRDFPAAEAEYIRAVDLLPEDLLAYQGLVRILIAQGRDDRVVPLLRPALECDRIGGGLVLGLSEDLRREGKYGIALEALEFALRRCPENLDVSNALAWVLSTCPDAELRDPSRALQIAEAATRVDGESPHLLDTLGAALAANSRFDEAAAAAASAAELAEREDRVELARALRDREETYRSGRALFQSP